MQTRFLKSCVLGACAVLLGCSQSDGIDSDGAVFDGIDADTAITLTGTEPFWSFTIAAASNGAHAARYTDPNESDGRLFQATRFAGNNGLGFSGELDGKDVQIAITPGDCSDGMSDRVYPFAATIAWGDEALMGCAYTEDAPFAERVTP